MVDYRAESYKKIASDTAKRRTKSYSAGGTFETAGGKIGYAGSGVSTIKSGGSISSGGSAKASDYVYVKGSTGTPTGSRSIAESQALASGANFESLQTKLEYQEFKRMQSLGIISAQERFVSSQSQRQAYLQQQREAGGVLASAGVYNKFLYETKGAFPTEKKRVGQREVSVPIAFLKKGESGFIYPQSSSEAYFNPLGADLGSLLRGEKYVFPANLRPKEKESFLKTFIEFEKGALVDYPISLARGTGKILASEASAKRSFGAFKVPNAPFLLFPDFSLKQAERRLDMFSRDKDVQNVAILGASYGLGAGLGVAFGAGRSALSGFATRGLVSQSFARYAPATIGFLGTGAYVAGEGFQGLKVAGSVSSREFGFYAGSRVTDFFSFTKGFKAGYGLSPFGRRETAIREASELATRRIGFYTSKSKQSYLSEGRGDVLLKFYNEAGLQRYKLPFRSKNVEYTRLLEEPKATFFYGLKGNPKETFYSGVALSSGKQFASLKVKGGKYLVVDELVPKGELLPKITRGFFSKFEPRMRAGKFDVLARETFKLGKGGNYVGVGRQNIAVKSPIYTLSPLSVSRTSKSETLDRTIQSDVLTSKGRFLGAKGEYGFTQESYLTAKTARRGVSVETFGSTGVIDIATGKSFPAFVSIKQELPFYRFVDYAPKQKTLLYVEKKGGNIKVRLPTESVVYQESKILARGFIGEPRQGAKLNIVKGITIGQFESLKYGSREFPFLKNYATKTFAFKDLKTSIASMAGARRVYNLPTSHKGDLVVEGYVPKSVLSSLPKRESPEGISNFVKLVEKNLAPSGDVKVRFSQQMKDVPVQKSSLAGFDFKFSPSPVARQLPKPRLLGGLGLRLEARLQGDIRSEGLARTYGFLSLKSEGRLFNVGYNQVVNQPEALYRNVSRLSNRNILLNVNINEGKVIQETRNVQLTRQRQESRILNKNPRMKFRVPNIEIPVPKVPKFRFGLPSFPSMSGKKRSAKRKRDIEGRSGLRVLPDLYSVSITEGRTSSIFARRSREATIPRLTRAVRRQVGLAFGGYGLGLVPTEEIRTKRIKYPKFF